MNQQNKTCQNCKKNFVIEPEDFDFYKKIEVPPPTFCPECRLIRRLAWRNERTLHSGECDKCGKPIITVFSKKSGLTVYCRPCWWSDSWDALDYGIDFDPARPFLTQLRELFNKVPVMALFGIYDTLENSEYTNMVSHLKNCYFVTYCDHSENCLYGSLILRSKDSVDNLLLFDSELCYGNTNCKKCYQTLFSTDCENCNNILFSRNCLGCSDCFGCVNLRNKKYYIFNEPHTKTEYEKFINENSLDSFTKIKKLQVVVDQHWKNFPRRYIHGIHNNNVSGDYISYSKNTHGSFMVDKVEDSKWCSYALVDVLTNSYDFTHYGPQSELLYESLQVGFQSSRVFFSWFVLTAINVEYSLFNIGGQNVFGSAGLKKKEYCILNKQYSKNEYQVLRDKIIQQMKSLPYKDAAGNVYSYGEFFPIEMSPFGYNETGVQEFFPLTQEIAKSKKYQWGLPENKNYKITEPAEDLPDSINEVDRSITNEVISCLDKGNCNHSCATAFKIVPQEFEFYKRMKLALPRYCPSCRHYQRLKNINPPKLWHRQCMCDYAIYKNTAKHQHHLTGQCPNEFETSYAPERPEIVYCEPCYQAEVI